MKSDITYNPMVDPERRRQEFSRRAQLFARCQIALAAAACVLLAAMALYNILSPRSAGSVKSAGSTFHHPASISSRLQETVESCSDPCKIVLVESIPEGMEFNSSTSNPSIFQAWVRLMSEARSSVDIASFYWTLTNEDTSTQEPSASQVRANPRSFTLSLPLRGSHLSSHR